MWSLYSFPLSKSSLQKVAFRGISVELEVQVLHLEHEEPTRVKTMTVNAISAFA